MRFRKGIDEERRHLIDPRTGNDSNSALIAIIFLLAIRLVLSPFALLIPEEAYYWMYSQFPSIGYLDHPPMVAWSIGAGTALFGDVEFGVRLCNWLFTVGSTFLCFRLGADWYGRRAGATAALLFNITPLFCGTGFVVTPDATLLFFWLLTLVAVTRAYRTGKVRWWLLAGLGTGLGFLSKYPALFLAASTFVFLLLDSRGRRMLTGPGPWLALILAVIAASPVIVWNYQNDWASFQFQSTRRLHEQGGIKLGKTLEWIGVQFLLLTPLIFALFTAAWYIALRRFRRRNAWRWRLAACFAIPWLAVCLWHGLHVTVNINWPLPAYLSLLPVAVPLLRSPFGLHRTLAWMRNPAHIRRYARTLVAVNAAVLLFMTFRIPGVPRPNIFASWDRLGEAVEVIEDTMLEESGAEPLIIPDGKYKLASELAFYMRDWPESEDWKYIVPASTALGGGLSYANWHKFDDMTGRNALFISTKIQHHVLEVLGSAFVRIDEPEQFYTEPLGFGFLRHYWVVRCWDYRGLDPEVLEKLRTSHAFEND